MYTTRAFCKVERAVYLDQCFYHYVLDREGSIMNEADNKRMFDDEIPFWREHIACIRQMVSPQMADLAGYHFQRRLLFYYIYDSGIVSRGDRMRRKLFFLSPSAYAIVVWLYDRIVIPLRH